MPADPNPETLTVRVPYGTRARVERAAAKLGRSPAWLLREAVLRAVQRTEAAPERAPPGEGHATFRTALDGLRGRGRPVPERPRGPGMD